jgi:hypothetical protein
MHILYDHQILPQQNYGGISRYFCELMNQFSTDPNYGIYSAISIFYECISKNYGIFKKLLVYKT